MTGHEKQRQYEANSGVPSAAERQHSRYLDAVERGDEIAADTATAWGRYFTNHPEIQANWGEQNGRMPKCECFECCPVG